MAESGSKQYESESESDLEPYSQQYLDDLLEKAVSSLESETERHITEEEVILLQQEGDEL